MRIALGFWGLTRSLKDHTIESIRKNVFDVLSEGGVEYDVFIHTYEKGEGDVVADCKLLEPMRCEIHRHDDVVPIIDFPKYRSRPDPWGGSYGFVDNFLLAMWSKSRLTKLIASSGVQYDRVVFIRPDCLYLTPLRPVFLAAARDGVICIPDFERCGKHKMNDRFAICTWRDFRTYGDIFRFIYAISKAVPSHSETIVGSVMQGSGLSIIPIPFYFNRIRSNGRSVEGYSVVPHNARELVRSPVLRVESIGNDGQSTYGVLNFRFIPA
jgi:hypothetical protein